MRVAETDTYKVNAYDDSGVITVEQNFSANPHERLVKFQYSEIDLLISILKKAKEAAKSDRY